MAVTNTDAVLWYDVGIFGEMGYAVPNWSNDIGSLNPQILQLTELIGRNLFNIMHHEDADMRIPPSLNTLTRIHKLYVRSRQILAGRGVPSGDLNFEMLHGSPAGEVFRVYPVPYFKVRNSFLRAWAGLMLSSLTCAMQHTENRKQVEISQEFAGTMGGYIKRVYDSVGVELFGKTREEVADPTFELTPEELASYNPSAFFTNTEMTDTVPRLDYVLTEDRLEFLAEGIPVTSLPDTVKPWPVNLTNVYASFREDADTGNNQNREANTSGTGTTSGIAMPVNTGV